MCRRLLSTFIKSFMMISGVRSLITDALQNGKSGSSHVEYCADCSCSSGKFHRGIGWEEFTDAAIMALNGQDRPIVFILWGAPAQRKKAMLNNPKHLILTAPHPSPLSAYRGFFGSRPFSKTNDF